MFGLRTIKTVLSVFISLLLCDLLLNSKAFYAVIAAILCMQSDMNKSWIEAIYREIATLIGGGFGIVFLFCERLLFFSSWAVIRWLIVSIMLIPIIYLSVYLNLKKGTYLMCVVFLSIVLVHNLDINITDFAFRRILETSIGIVVSLSVNYFFKFK